MKHKRDRGNIGMIVLMVVLLIVGYLAMKNFEKTAGGNIALPGSNEAVSTNTIIDRFKGDAKQIENLQNREMPPIDGQGTP